MLIYFKVYKNSQNHIFDLMKKKNKLYQFHLMNSCSVPLHCLCWTVLYLFTFFIAYRILIPVLFNFREIFFFFNNLLKFKENLLWFLAPFPCSLKVKWTLKTRKKRKTKRWLRQNFQMFQKFLILFFKFFIFMREFFMENGELTTFKLLPWTIGTWILNLKILL